MTLARLNAGMTTEILITTVPTSGFACLMHAAAGKKRRSTERSYELPRATPLMPLG
jgi:hypothetical protein